MISQSKNTDISRRGRGKRWRATPNFSENVRELFAFDATLILFSSRYVIPVSLVCVCVCVCPCVCPRVCMYLQQLHQAPPHDPRVVQYEVRQARVGPAPQVREVVVAEVVLADVQHFQSRDALDDAENLRVFVFTTTKRNTKEFQKEKNTFEIYAS